jgi:hypothetical protein
MSSTTAKTLSSQKYRLPFESATDLQLVGCHLYGDDEDELASLDNNMLGHLTLAHTRPDHQNLYSGEIASGGRSIIGTGVNSSGVNSSIAELLQRIGTREFVTDFIGPPGTASAYRKDSRSSVYSGGTTFHAGSMGMGALVEPILGFDVDQVAHVPNPMPSSVGAATIMTTALQLDSYRSYFARDGMMPILRQATGSTNLGGAYIVEPHRRPQKPDLTARIALRLADIPDMIRAEDSVLPTEEVVSAAILVSGYLPATTVLPQIEIDDSTGSISLVWRDHLHDNVFSLEIPNSRYLVGVGYGKDFSKFKPWRHSISDERKIVGEIEACEAARKLLSGA